MTYCVDRLLRVVGAAPETRSAEKDAGRTRSQRRTIRLFEKHGAKYFRVLRSAETGLRHFKRPGLRASTCVTPPEDTP